MPQLRASQHEYPILQLETGGRVTSPGAKTGPANAVAFRTEGWEEAGRQLKTLRLIRERIYFTGIANSTCLSGKLLTIGRSRRGGFMGKSRVENLEEMLQAHPEDTFARYGLALEMTNSGNLNGAWKHFEYLLTKHADYLPSYFHAGVLLGKLERVEEARKTFTRGIQVAIEQKDSHTQSELQAALEELEDR